MNAAPKAAVQPRLSFQFSGMCSGAKKLQDALPAYSKSYHRCFYAFEPPAIECYRNAIVVAHTEASTLKGTGLKAVMKC